MDDYFGNTAGSGYGPGSAPAYPGYQGYAPPAAPAARSGGLTLVGRLGPVLGGLLVLGLVAAVGIPAYRAHRDRRLFERTTVGLPPSIAGATQMSGSGIDRFRQVVVNLPLPGQHLAAVYGTGTTPQIAVGVTRYRMTADDRKAFWSDADRDNRLVLRDVAPGPLGGEMRCAPMPGLAAVCAFTDAGAYGVIVLFQAGDVDGTARVARAAVEHRAG